ncbi:MAG: transposase [Candidatus Acidiferrales bacterium]
MADWPHSPLHRLDASGTYMVTAGTYRKEPFFGNGTRLSILQRHLFALCTEYTAALQAWAIFPNHYHFVTQFENPSVLRGLVRRLYSATAQEVNRLDLAQGRKVWFQYWDSQITFQGSYFARLRYVHENAVHHGIVRRASNYPWCSAGWFERKATPGFRKTVSGFPCDKLEIPDTFQVDAGQCESG